MAERRAHAGAAGTVRSQRLGVVVALTLALALVPSAGAGRKTIWRLERGGTHTGSARRSACSRLARPSSRSAPRRMADTGGRSSLPSSGPITSSHRPTNGGSHPGHDRAVRLQRGRREDPPSVVPSRIAHVQRRRRLASGMLFMELRQRPLVDDRRRPLVVPRRLKTELCPHVSGWPEVVPMAADAPAVAGIHGAYLRRQLTAGYDTRIPHPGWGRSPPATHGDHIGATAT